MDRRPKSERAQDSRDLLARRKGVVPVVGVGWRWGVMVVGWK